MTPPSRAREERAIRIALLIVPTAALVASEAVLIWVLGFAHRPHRVAYAVIIGAISAVVFYGPLLYVYRLRIKQIRKL